MARIHNNNEIASKLYILKEELTNKVTAYKK